MKSYVASQRQYLDHLYPLWESTGGEFLVTPDIEDEAKARGIDATPMIGWLEHLRWRLGPVIVGAYGDYTKVRDCFRPIVFVNHGNGQSFNPPHPAYSGGPNREQVHTFLEPNEYAANLSRNAYPNANVAVVGCPKLDTLTKTPKPIGETVVAIGFHWDCLLYPETRSTFEHFKPGLRALAERFTVIGHGHPKAWSMLEKQYRKLGIEPVRTFEEVVERAHVYMCDGSSTLYEFAALDRPVVVLNGPHFRRDVNHGLRFWDYADVGPQCNTPKGMVAAVEAALADDGNRRREIVSQVYPYIGEATERSVREIDRINAQTPENDMVTHIYSTKRQPDGRWVISGVVGGTASRVTVELGDNPTLQDCRDALAGVRKLTEPDLPSMTLAELRDYASMREIHIPSSARTKAQIVEVINGGG